MVLCPNYNGVARGLLTEFILVRIAGDVVMLSHLALKLHYVKKETEELTAEEDAIDSRLVKRRCENFVDCVHPMWLLSSFLIHLS